MEPGDLVVGRTTTHRFGVTVEPIPGAVGLVLEIDEPTKSARVLYNGWIYTYFLSELQVLRDSGDESERMLSTG